MATENDLEGFLAAFNRSGLLPHGQEGVALAELAEQGVKHADARGLAEALIDRGVLTDWQAEMLLRGKHRGFHVGSYVLRQPLGHGAMGSVYLAQHVMMNRCCAIKVLPAKYRDDPDLLDRFQIEARAVAALDHPNIVRAYDFNKDTSTGNDVYYLVMEYVDGQDLQRLIAKDGVLEYQRAADFIRQAAVGLAHAHEAGFVHRDIKPANLLVDGKGILKILDLGLARFASESGKASQAGAWVSGTPDYIAPEQIANSPSLDGRADIYSLGLTFYYLLVGHQPFMKPTLPEILTAHRNEYPPPIEETRRDVPFELTTIFEKMTAKAPEQRYKNAGEAAAALQSWLSIAASGQPSRLSAILSAATRSKQRAAADSATARPPSKEIADLELAPLEEQAPRPTVSMQAPTTGTHRSRTSAKDAPSRAGREQGRTASARPALVHALPHSSPAAAAAPTAVSDLLADLPLEPDLSAAPLPAVSHGVRYCWRRIVRTVRRSPWLWTGVGGLFLAGLLWFLTARL